MGSSSIFNNANIKPKEKWDFDGKISFKNLEFDNNYCDLKGNLDIIELNGRKEIIIKVSLKRNIDKKKSEKFVLKGIESKKLNFNTIAYTIENNVNSKFYFSEDIIMTKKDHENASITGELKEGKYPLNLDLNLYLPKQKKEANNIIINDYQYSLMKLNKDIDILSNSICGFKNLINTCYINSSFQILIHIRHFIEIIRDNKDFEGNVVGNINSILELILKGYKSSKYINPSIFVNNFKLEHEEYNNYSQKDSEMFLEDLIWNINTVLSVLPDKRITYYYSTKTIKEKLLYEYIIKSEEDTYYKINDLFYVLFVHEKKCELCSYATYYFDETFGLKLSFENTKFNDLTIDLYSLIMQNYRDPVKIKSSFCCQNCKNCFVMNETIRIARLPKILIITLQKTNIENTKKIPWTVKFQNEFGIKEIVDGGLCKQGICLYNIFAINNHSGYSPYAGHYYSYIYLKDLKSWFSFNDESVTPIKEIKPGVNNYILFYKQKDNYKNN